MSHYLVVDTETGGLTPDFSLLTVFLGAYDEDFKMISSRHILIKPDDGNYKVSASALAINNINLVEHDKEAYTQSQARSIVKEFLNIHSYAETQKLNLVGHNVHFDLAQIFANLCDKQTWNRYVSYRVIDTGVIGQFLKLTGVIQAHLGGSMSDLLNHFKVPYQGQLHNAETDGKATMELLKHMIAADRGVLEDVKDLTAADLRTLGRVG